MIFFYIFSKETVPSGLESKTLSIALFENGIKKKKMVLSFFFYIYVAPVEQQS